MGRLIDDLLDLSKIERGKIELKKTENDFQIIVQEQLELNKILAQKKNIEIRSDLENNIVFRFDKHRIAQVIDNLISNAIKFSPHHSTIFVSSRKNGDEVIFSVRDEGPGISIEEQKLIFQPFQTLSAKPTGGESSSGLGLNIAKNFVSLHGGEIGVSNEPGHGATFYFTLPCKDDLQMNPSSV